MEITILGLGLWVKRALGVQDLGSQVPRNLRLKSECLFNTSNRVWGNEAKWSLEIPFSTPIKLLQCRNIPYWE